MYNMVLKGLKEMCKYFCKGTKCFQQMSSLEDVQFIYKKVSQSCLLVINKGRFVGPFNPQISYS